jgi:histidinol phosphatase-like PHP family hydrolase
MHAIIITKCLLVSNLTLHHSRLITDTVQPPYTSLTQQAIAAEQQAIGATDHRSRSLNQKQNKKMPILMNYWQERTQKKKKCCPSKSKQRERAEAVTAQKV